MTNTRQLAVNRHASALQVIGVEDGTVFELLVRHPRSTAADLAARGDLGLQQITPALSRICAAGLAHRIPGQPARYTAGAPELVLGRLVDDRERELRAARVELERLAAIHRDATRVAHPAELIEVVTGADTIHARVGQVQAEAREEIWGFDRAPYLRRPGHNLESEQQRLREGIRFRVIYDREAFGLPGRLEQDILPSLARGEQARVRERLPMKMFVADRSVAVIPIGSGAAAADAAYVVHPCALLDALVALFEAEWERGLPVSATGVLGPAHPSDAPAYARELLPLLAAGHTDEGIARALGLSPRTTQRRVRRLMDELHASTRFQAGLAASSRGWL